MDAASMTTLTSSTFFIVIAAIIAIAVGFVAYTLIVKKNTVPSGSFIGPQMEGFQGPAKGVSSIPCGQESSHVTDILGIFSDKMSTTDDGSPDFKEFKEIMSKMCCMKHDLMGTAQVVSSTLYIPYNNTHDRENPADTVARCFTKSIPPRDLDIIFGTWKNRGLSLLDRLCTSYKLRDRESEKVRKHFTALWSDVFDIAKGACSPPEKAPEYGSPRDPKGVMPSEVEELGEYKGYY
jgi:hypothetical protein